MANATTTLTKPAPPAVETFTVKLDGKAVVVPKVTSNHAAQPASRLEINLAAGSQL